MNNITVQDCIDSAKRGWFVILHNGRILGFTNETRWELMIKCRKCGCNCDPADIRGGICDDCREEEKQRLIRAETVRRIMNSPFYQSKLNVEGE